MQAWVQALAQSVSKIEGMRKQNIPDPANTREERDRALAKLVAQKGAKKGSQSDVAADTGVSVYVVHRAWKQYGAEYSA